jgi:hypothetical protein
MPGRLSTVDCRVFSSITAVAAVVYPDSDKISIWTTNGNDDIVVRRTSGVDYWEGESRQQTSDRVRPEPATSRLSCQRRFSGLEPSR